MVQRKNLKKTFPFPEVFLSLHVGRQPINSKGRDRPLAVTRRDDKYSAVYTTKTKSKVFKKNSLLPEKNTLCSQIMFFYVFFTPLGFIGPTGVFCQHYPEYCIFLPEEGSKYNKRISPQLSKSKSGESFSDQGRLFCLHQHIQ